MLVLVAAIVAALALSPVGAALADGLRTAVCRILAQDCGGSGSASGGAAPDDLQPAACEVFASTTSDNGTVKIAFFTIGGDYVFTRSTSSDGETTITFVDTADVGVTVGAGGKLQFTRDGRTTGGRLAAEAGARVGLQTGDSWVFDSPEDADHFQAAITDERNEERFKWVSPGGYLLNELLEELLGEADIPEPQVAFRAVEGSGDVSVRGDLGVAGVGVEAGTAVVVGQETDARDGSSTTYYRIEGSVGGSAGAVLGLSGGVDRAGVVKLKRDRNRSPVELQIVDESQVSVGGLLELSTEGLTMEGLMSELEDEAALGLSGGAQSTRSIVATTTVALDDARSRAVVEEWFSAGAAIAAAGERAVDGALVERRAQATDDFSELLYEQGRVAVVEYDGETTGLGIAAEVALGPKVGLDVGRTTETSSAVGAAYLGAPANGRRVLRPFPACVPE